LNPRAPLGKKLASALKAGLHYAAWYPAQWNPLARSFAVHRQLAPHLSYVSRAAHRLARRLFHAMVLYQVALEKKQALLGRLVEIGTELFTISATCARADALHNQDPTAHAGVIDLADLFSKEARRRIEENFRAAKGNHDPEAYRLAQRVTKDEYAWLERGAVEFPFK
jgi:hypothetical protein